MPGRAAGQRAPCPAQRPPPDRCPQRDRRKAAHLAGFSCTHCPQSKQVCPQCKWGQNSSMVTTTYARFSGLSPLSPQKKNDSRKKTRGIGPHPVPWCPHFWGYIGARVASRRNSKGTPGGYGSEGEFGGRRRQVEAAPVGGCVVPAAHGASPAAPTASPPPAPGVGSFRAVPCAGHSRRMAALVCVAGKGCTANGVRWTPIGRRYGGTAPAPPPGVGSFLA
jgi:hypothetical protein